MKSKVAILASSLLLSATALAATKSKTIEYKKGSDTFEGLLVTPEKVGPKTPGVLLIHNWMGVSEETKKQAERYAHLGYVVFAADIYGKGKAPKSVDEASKLAGKFKGDRKLFREHLNTGLSELKKQSNVDASKLAAIGFCFGGTGVIELARSGADVKGVISFHGDLDSPTPADGKNIKAKLVAFAGADDPFQKAENLSAFEAEMRDSKVDWQLVKFGGAVHSFTERAAGNDNSKGAAYNEKADERSFADAQLFLREVFK